MALAGAPVTYRAFISYSHRDATFARRLHRQLESYRLPSKLVGSETARGIVPDRLSPIFRDREELSAGESLSDQVLAALAASEALIIICSPNAKASLWVGKEIENFRMLHPDRPVLAALIEGEPDEAFPAALTSTSDLKTPNAQAAEQTLEPIAADFRKAKDGHRLARLKLAAGLTGVPLDALVQRDAQRQFRRVMAVTIAAVIALLVMAGLLVMALQARKEADRQRQEAEGLVEYMLTDLRDKLKGVGRLDVMTAVNERAMSYYGGQQALEGLPPESLDRRARILHAMGEDDEKRGDLDKALAKFKEAHRTTAAVLAQKPDDADAIVAHAQSEYWVGFIDWRKNDKASTAAHWSQYLALAQTLQKIEGRTKRSLSEVAYARINLCQMYLRDGISLKLAERNCSLAVQNLEEALKNEKQDSQLQLELSNFYAWYADVFLKMGDLNRARIFRTKQINNIEKIIVRDNDARYLRELISSVIGLSKILQLSGNSNHSLSLINKYSDKLQYLIEIDPSNNELKLMNIRYLLSKRKSYINTSRFIESRMTDNVIRSNLNSLNLRSEYNRKFAFSVNNILEERKY